MFLNTVSTRKQKTMLTISAHPASSTPFLPPCIYTKSNLTNHMTSKMPTYSSLHASKSAIGSTCRKSKKHRQTLHNHFRQTSRAHRRRTSLIAAFNCFGSAAILLDFTCVKKKPALFQLLSMLNLNSLPKIPVIPAVRDLVARHSDGGATAQGCRGIRGIRVVGCRGIRSIRVVDCPPGVNPSQSLSQATRLATAAAGLVRTGPVHGSGPDRPAGGG